MKRELLERLRCPKTGQRLTLDTPQPITDFIESGWLVSVDGQHRYPIRNGIPRFVPEVNYAENFGMQWNYFRQTQLDSHSGHPISANRFWKATGWRPEDMKGQWVLDAGCGAVRFAEVALNAGANVVALDYSSAVDACYANLEHHPNLHVVQGDIYALPLERESFSFVYSLGVLQHTPDVAKAFAALPPMLHDGGETLRGLLRKVLEITFPPQVLAAAHHQATAPTRSVRRAANRRAHPAPCQPQPGKCPRAGRRAQATGAGSQLLRDLAFERQAAERVVPAGYL
jgi:SAM-dependent methyltransferase